MIELTEKQHSSDQVPLVRTRSDDSVVVQQQVLRGASGELSEQVIRQHTRYSDSSMSHTIHSNMVDFS